MRFKTNHTLFSSMSNQAVLNKDDKDLSNFEIVKRSHTLVELQSESSRNLLSSPSSQCSSQSTKEENSKQQIEECQQICRVGVSKQGDSESSTSKLIEEDEEEEDGFKTPTSMDHKISVPSQCPPAPRKTKPALKRKSFYYNNHCNCRHPLDVSKEVFELLLQTPHTKSLSSSQQSIKKFRR